MNLPLDHYLHIFNYLEVLDLHNLRQVNSQFKTIVDLHHPTGLHLADKIEEKRKKRINKLRYSNPLWELIQLNPHIDWPLMYLLKNKYTTLENILAYPRLKPYIKDFLCFNPNITPEQIIELNGKSNIANLQYNPNLKLEHVLKYNLTSHLVNIITSSKYSNEIWNYFKRDYYRGILELNFIQLIAQALDPVNLIEFLSYHPLS